jgi:predicted PurR-regulated permease PerM
METHTTKLPVYIKFSQLTVGIVAFFYILYIGREILAPIAFALIISILLNPVVKLFTQKRMNRVIAIITCITLLLIFLTAILFFIGSQITLFSDSLPQLRQKADFLLFDIINWCSDAFNISKLKLEAWVGTKRLEAWGQADNMIGGALTTLSDFFLLVFLVPVYIFMLLFYKPLLLDFVSQIFKKETHNTVAEILTSTKSLIQSYLIGLLIEMAIMVTLNSTALLIIGVDYAILFGIIGGFLNLIPYIGGIVAMALPMLMAFLTQGPMSAFFVMIAYIIVQIIDNNYLVPKIVASKVKVNALVSVVVVLIGGAMWGLSGMFLSIPFTGIAKVIFDKIPKLKPLGFLIGDTMPPIGKSIFNLSLIKEKGPEGITNLNKAEK